MSLDKKNLTKKCKIIDNDILKIAPKDSTVVFNALLIDESLIESMGAMLRLMQPRSLADIKKIVALEKHIEEIEIKYKICLNDKNYNYTQVKLLNKRIEEYEKKLLIKEQVK